MTKPLETLLHWQPADGPRPDHDELVLLHCPACDEPVGMGWWDDADAIWRSSEGANLNAMVAHWARVEVPHAG